MKLFVLALACLALAACAYSGTEGKLRRLQQEHQYLQEQLALTTEPAMREAIVERMQGLESEMNKAERAEAKEADARARGLVETFLGWFLIGMQGVALLGAGMKGKSQ